jgi:hypothetical protein
MILHVENHDIKSKNQKPVGGLSVHERTKKVADLDIKYQKNVLIISVEKLQK